MIVKGTPIEPYELNGIQVLVKREDLCCPAPGPPFSKMRGVVAHMAKRKGRVFGVLDIRHSKAGWAVAYAGRAQGDRVVNYWPCYKSETTGELRAPQSKSKALGAELVELQAGRSAILFHRAKRDLFVRFGHNAYMMPNALKLIETVSENADEVFETELPESGTMVISVGSGTVASGVLNGLCASGASSRYDIILHMGYSRSKDACRDYILRMGGVSSWAFQTLTLVDEGYRYADSVDFPVPFPCSEYYDAKAWKWLAKNAGFLRQPIVFWNIGD